MAPGRVSRSQRALQAFQSQPRSTQQRANRRGEEDEDEDMHGAPPGGDTQADGADEDLDLGTDHTGGSVREPLRDRVCTR
jgi:hypothetical protein